MAGKGGRERRTLDQGAVGRFRDRRAPQQRRDRARRDAALAWALMGLVAVTALLLLLEPLGAISLAFGRTATVGVGVGVDVLLAAALWVVARGRRVSAPIRRGVGLALVAAAVLVASTLVGLLLEGSSSGASALPLVALAVAGLALVSRHLLRRDDT